MTCANKRYTETCTQKPTQNINMSRIQAHTSTYKAAEITGIWGSHIYRITDNAQRPNLSINWVSRPAVISLALPVA